jgi:general stress protein 26
MIEVEERLVKFTLLSLRERRKFVTATISVESFEEIEQEFIERVHGVVWCNMATEDTQGRLRSRILHPIWEGQTGWVITRRHSLKAKHLAQNPYVSLAYVADVARPVYVDCVAEWADEPEARSHVWELYRAAPPPLGYDPDVLYQGMDQSTLGILKFTPWRIEVANIPNERRVWRK